MPLKITVQKDALVPGMTSSQITDLYRQGLLHIARSWHASYSAFKFTSAAARKYNYAERRTKEIRRGRPKLSKKTRKPMAPNGLPLVWTGRTRATAKSSTTFGARGRVSWASAPLSVLNFKPGGIPMRYEYTLVLPSEQRLLGRAAEQMLRRRFERGKRGVNVEYVTKVEN